MNLLAFGLPRISTCQPYPPENGQATMRNDAFNTTLLKEQLKQFVTKMLWSYDELPLVREASPLERPSMSSPWHLLCQGCKKIIIYWGSALDKDIQMVHSQKVSYTLYLQGVRRSWTVMSGLFLSGPETVKKCVAVWTWRDSGEIFIFVSTLPPFSLVASVRPAPQ